MRQVQNKDMKISTRQSYTGSLPLFALLGTQCFQFLLIQQSLFRGDRFVEFDFPCCERFSGYKRPPSTLLFFLVFRDLFRMCLITLQ
jgi:hypothetical protein